MARHDIRGLKLSDGTYSLTSKDVYNLNDNFIQLSQEVFGNSNFTKKIQKQVLKNVKDIEEITYRVSDAEGGINDLEFTATSLTNRISNAEGDVSTLQNTATGLTNRISNAEGDIFALETTAQGLALDVAAADGRALNAQATADAVTLNFNDLEIGVVNLVKNGSLEYDISEWTAWSNTTMSKTSDGIRIVPISGGTYDVGAITPGFALKNGQKYTLSFDAASYYSTSVLDYIWLLNTDGGNVRLPSIPIVSTDSNYRRYKVTFTSSSSGNNVKVLIGRTAASGTSTGFILRNVQLEEGNKGTPFKNAENEIFAASHIFNRNGYTMKDSNGVEIMSLSKGIANEQNIGRVDNVESGYRMRIPFHIGVEVSQIVQAILKWDVSKFRTYSKGAASGGGTKTTPSGGGSTSGPSSKSTADNSAPATFSSNTQTELSYPNEGKHYHNITSKQLTHSHGMAHTHTTPSHSHSVDITHSHDPVFGILEQNISDNIIEIYVDGVYRTSVNASQGEVDLSTWVTTSGWHRLELASVTLKRIDANLFLKTYIRR